MSIYATLWTIKVERDPVGCLEDNWIEVWGQAVPNHINDENGYSGAGWDEWLPPFVHQDGCVRKEHIYYDKLVETISPGVQIRQFCDESNEGAERQVSYECGCGHRAVFILDDLTTKGSERNGQEYVNPVLVLSGHECQTITWESLLTRIEEAVEKRHGDQAVEPSPRR